MKTIFQSESNGRNELKGSAVILADGAIEEVFTLGAGLNMSILIEVQDAQTGKTAHTFVVTCKA